MHAAHPYPNYREQKSNFKPSGNTVLITGGASGIGLGLAIRFLNHGNTVIICGRRQDKLAEVQSKYPEIKTKQVDVSREEERVALFEWVTSNFPATNILVNNAGIQHAVKLTEVGDWKQRQQELAINLEAPIHLSTLFYSHLQKQQNASIINVTSGLSFGLHAGVPIYCATKAGLHSFTLSLRYQLVPSGVNVIELVPPAVDTDLQGPGLHKFGANLDEYCDDAWKKLEAGDQEIGFGYSDKVRLASRQEIDQINAAMNSPKPQ